MRIKRERDKNYYSFRSEIVPNYSIKSGDRLIVETFDAAGGMFMEGWEYVRPNPVSGPFYVKGAMPGDTLEIEVHDIKLVGTGYMHIPNPGEPTKYTRNGHEFVKAEAMPDGNLRVINNDGLLLPSSPMVGVIGVAVPPDLEGDFYSTDAGNHGGNMDNMLIKPGAKVYLPVYNEGALLGIGDAHGIMGDGEIFDQGMEMCADIDITVTVRKDMKISRPLVISEDIIATTATAETVEEACNLTVSDMRYILETYYGLSHVDAGLVIGFYGNLRICQIVNKTMRMEIPREAIKRFNPMQGVNKLEHRKPKWAKKVPPHKIKRLYELDAKGIQDNELVDDVGISLYTRVDSMLQVTSSNLAKAICIECRTEIPHTYRREFTLVCSKCGWSMNYGEFNDSHKGQTLHGLGALAELQEFYDRYPKAKTYAEKMIIIDWLIHTFHGNLAERPSRPVASNVIDGSNAAVAKLIYDLAYDEGSTVAREELDIWLDKFHRSIHRHIDPSTGKVKTKKT
ncbi:MAG: acetamidase/formamidase family protein [Defluviitaleaceae bacterium]|nr:acetamidase/formamidase family protein [Defluviitaleaceae bacterium]